MLKESMFKVGGRGRGIHFALDDEAPFAEVEQSMREYLDRTDGFFRGGRASVDPGRHLARHEDMARLKQILEEDYELEIAELRCAVERLEAGLAEATGIPVNILPRESALFRDRTLLVKSACRSGTIIHHEGEVMVLGDVNPGAEVTAGGDVVVFGNLLGVVAAGVNGDQEAMVAALSLRPTQLRIGRHLEVALNEKKRKKNQSAHPEVAFVRGGEIVVEPFNGQFQRIRAWEGP